MDSKLFCEFCKKTFKSKSSLKTHTETNKKCITNRGGDVSEILKTNNYKCVCEYETFNKHDFNKHKLKCKIYVIICKKDEEIEELKHIIDMLKPQLREKEIEIRQKDNQIESYKELLDKAVSKPMITTTNNNTQNIKGNQIIQNILSDKYDEYTSQERIEQIARESIEKYFWEGQAGISRFCVDHIITTDEGKKIICCTDMARRKFKYLKDDRLIEDIEARAFTEKISVPIKKVCREVYDSTIKKIEEEREEKTDAFELNLLDHKTNRAQKSLLDIINIDDNNQNTEYKNELSILLKI